MIKLVKVFMRKDFASKVRIANFYTKKINKAFLFMKIKINEKI